MKKFAIYGTLYWLLLCSFSLITLGLWKQSMPLLTLSVFCCILTALSAIETLQIWKFEKNKDNKLKAMREGKLKQKKKTKETNKSKDKTFKRNLEV